MSKRYKPFDPKPKELRLVMVRWGDAWSLGSWQDISYPKDTTKPALIHSVGWLVNENKEGVFLSARIDADNDNIGNCSFIPRGMIKDVTQLRQGRLVKKK